MVNIIIGVAIISLIIIVFFVGFVISDMAITPKVKSYEQVSTNLKRKNLLDKDIFKTYSYEEKMIDGYEGCPIYTRFFKNGNSKKTVVIAHGFSVNMQRSALYFDIFYERGFNVMLFDQRYHGKSGGAKTTFGAKEKYDLKNVSDYVRQVVVDNEILGLHGESMGSATVLLNGEIDDKIDFIVADCGYTSMKDQMNHVYKHEVKLPKMPFLYLGLFFAEIKGKFKIKEASPIDAASHIKSPVLVIHGEKDDYVPFYMGEQIYEQLTGEKEFVAFERASHAQSICEYPIQYRETVGKFLDKYNI